ncbi:MAG: alpha/beta hydrolase [Solobacterium sp.]|nr:alpha/beta hydrolase [Solobacterium sp.]
MRKSENLTVTLPDGKTMYIAEFGSGSRNLILLPGLSDGLKTVKGTAKLFGVSYRTLAEDHTVYFASRVNELEEGYTIADMADDMVSAMKELGIEKADIVGVSQGGMIAQEIALRHPDVTERLVLAVTAARPNDLIQERIRTWMRFAEAGNYRDLMIDTAEHSYTERYLSRMRRLYPILTRVGKPASFKRFLIEADAILHHDVYDRLAEITCPTLVITAAKDDIVGAASGREIAEMITGSEHFEYPDLGHGFNDETNDWQDRIHSFLVKV